MQEEQEAIEHFIETRTKIFAGRRDMLERLCSFVAADGPGGYLVVQAAPGSGKSAVLAKLCTTFGENASGSPWVFKHFCGASARSTDVVMLLERLCQELIREVGMVPGYKAEFYEMCEALPRLLERMASLKRVVIVIDALNQLENSHDAHKLQWLPRKLPTNVRVVVSTLAGVCEKACEERLRAMKLQISPLHEEERRVVIGEYLRHYRRSWEESSIAALLGKAESGNPLYLKIAIEECRASGSPTDAISELPDAIPSLFTQMFERLERLLGRELVQKFLSSIAVSRGGLWQTELRQILRPRDRQKLPETAWNTLFASLTPYFLVRGESIDFFHEQVLKAVESHYLSAKEERVLAHKTVADYFATRGFGDPRTLSEYAYHLKHAEERDVLFELLFQGKFTRAQLREFENYHKVYESFAQALSLYAHGETPEEDYRLCWLALTAGNLAHEAQTNIAIAFHWARNGKMEKALSALQVLGEQQFYKAVLLLLWIEAGRQRRLPPEQRSKAHANMVMEKLDEYIPCDAVYWSWFAEKSFMAFWAGEVREILTVEQIGGILARNNSEGSLYKALARAGNIDQALDDVQRMQSLVWKSRHFIELLEFIGERREPMPIIEQAFATAQQIAENCHRNPELAKIAKAFAQVGDFNKAIESTRAMADACDESIALLAIAQELFRARDCDQAEIVLQQGLDLLQNIENAHKKARGLVEVATTLTVMGKREQLENTFCEAVTTAQNIESSSDRKEVLANVSKKMGQMMDCERALAVVENIQDAHGKSTVLLEVGKRYVEAGNRNQAIMVLQQAAALAQDIEDDFEKNVILAEIAEKLAQAGDCAQALQIVSIIDTVHSQIWALAGVAEVLTKTGEETSSLLRQMQNLLEDVDPAYRDSAFSALAQVHIAAGNLLEALATNSQMGCSSPELLDKIVKAQVQRGNFQEAIDTILGIKGFRNLIAMLLMIAKRAARAENQEQANRAIRQALDSAEKIDYEYHKSQQWTVIARALAQIGDHDKAQMVFLRTLDAGQKEIDHFKNSVALSQIVSALLQADRFREAVDTAQRIVDVDYKSTALVEIAEVAIQAGNKGEARAILEQAMEIVQTVEHPYGKILTLLQIADLAMQIADNEAVTAALLCAVEAEQNIEFGVSTRDAKKMFAELIAEKLPISSFADVLDTVRDSRARKQFLDNIGEASLQINSFDSAFAIVENLDDSEKSLALVAIADTLAHETAETKESVYRTMAKDLFNYTGNETNTALWRTKRTQVMAQMGVRGKALVLRQTLAAAETIDDNNAKSLALIAIAVAMASIQDRQARAVLQQALDSAQTIAEAVDKSEVLREIAKAATQMGDTAKSVRALRQILSTVQSIGDVYKKTRVLANTTKLLARPGNTALFPQALEIARSIGSEREQYQALTEIVKALVNAKERDTPVPLRQALHVATAIDDQYKSDALLAIMSALEQSEDDEVSQQILQMAQVVGESHEDSKLLLKLVEILAQRGEHEKSAAVLQQALDAAQTMEKTYDTNGAMVDAVRTVIRQRDFSQALEIVEKIADHSYQNIALRDIAIAASEVGDFTRAFSSIDAMVQETQITTDSYLRRQALSAVVENLAKAGNFQQALDSLPRIITYDKGGALFNIAEESVRAGNYAILPGWLKNAALPTQCIQDATRYYRENILKHAENPLPWLRQALTIFPFNCLLAWQGVADILVGHIRHNNWEHVAAIKEHFQI